MDRELKWAFDCLSIKAYPKKGISKYWIEQKEIDLFDSRCVQSRETYVKA